MVAPGFVPPARASEETAAAMDEQPELPLPPPPLRPDQPYLPARMVNEFQYCPRLAYLEWVQGEWAESADTVEGRGVHRRIDRGPGALPEPEQIGDDERIHARSVTLSSERLGLIAKLDLIEGEDGSVQPVDYKRGRRPHVPAGAYEPELVQLCVQGLVLEDNDYRCNEGALYFRESRERVRVRFDDALRSKALAAVHGLRLVAASGHIPPPLEDSPKCPRCSLVAICLPDEVNFFRHGAAPRPLAVDRELALPVYVQATPGRVRKRGETLVIQTENDQETTARLIDTSHLVLMGAVDVTAPTLHELMRREIPVSWVYGRGLVSRPHDRHRPPQCRIAHRSVPCELRSGVLPALGARARRLEIAQWAHAAAPQLARRALGFRRRRTAGRKPEGARRGSRRPPALGPRRGRGQGPTRAAGCRRQRCGDLFQRARGDLAGGAGRGRRFRVPEPQPPAAYRSGQRDPLVPLCAAGARAQRHSVSGRFDSYRGFYHQPRYGRPALALDMMEPFRPLIADSVALTAINNGEVKPGDFVYAGRACALAPSGRRKVIAAFERRLGQEITHPLFGYRLSHRRLLEVQARLLGRHLMGEIAELPAIEPR
jgi:CRISPR-associated protein Cas4